MVKVSLIRKKSNLYFQIHANMLTANVIVGLTTYDPQGGPVNYRSFQELLADTRYITCLVVGRKVCAFSYFSLANKSLGSVEHYRYPSNQ